MATINLSMFSDTTTNFTAQPHNTSLTAEQPWLNTKFSLHDSDIEVRSADGFVFQLHRVVLGVTTGAFPGTEMATGGEMVQLTEPTNVLAILFAFLYPKSRPDLHGECFEMLAAVAEAAGKYEVFSAEDACNERLVKFVPQRTPEILVHAIKHNYPRLISATLPYFARAPLLPILERLPPSYFLPWVRYHESWKSLFKELAQYIKDLRAAELGHRCHFSDSAQHTANYPICATCVASLGVLITHFEKIDTLASLLDTLRVPNSEYLNSVLKCCRHGTGYSSRGQPEPICPFVMDVAALCQDKIAKLPSFASYLGLRV